ncbi:MAG: hypothetical protein JKX72_05825 [Robiginitomaculum sp.]|nr:hypothetical protein [Robiginitomaculum sp.]
MATGLQSFVIGRSRPKNQGRVTGHYVTDVLSRLRQIKTFAQDMRMSGRRE